jgi:hypothetical protein
MPARLTDEQTRPIMLAAGLEPLEPYPDKNNGPWRCRCECLACGETVTPRHSNVIRGHQGCRYCSGNGLPDHHAAATMLAARLRPLEPFPGTMNPWRCECMDCGRTLTPRHNTIQNVRGGCATCGYARNAERMRLDPSAAAEVMIEADLEPLEPMSRLALRPRTSNNRSSNGGATTSMLPKQRPPTKCRKADGRRPPHSFTLTSTRRSNVSTPRSPASLRCLPN